MASHTEHLRAASDHFALFGLEPQLGLDEEALQSKYLELTRLTHPDFAGSDLEAQAQAAELSARINEAYRILSDPEQRANYLLELLGGPSKHENESLPDGFLETIMGLREQLAEAKAEGDEPAIRAIEADGQAQRKARLGWIAELFAKITPAKPDNPAIRQAIRTELNALRYVQRLLEQARPERV